MQLADRRTTKYVTGVMRVIRLRGHATNAEIVLALREEFPTLSATTIHRVTQRLYEDGEIGKAPKASDGSCRYDINTEPHDHFVCGLCDMVRDISIPHACRSIIQCNAGDCSVSGPLVVSGTCGNCKKAWIS